MRNGIVIVASVLLASALIISGLWAWQGAGDLVAEWELAKPEVAVWAVWAVRSAAVASVAAAQGLLLVLVAGRLYRRGTIDSALAVVAVAVFAMASAAAVACGLAGR